MDAIAGLRLSEVVEIPLVRVLPEIHWDEIGRRVEMKMTLHGHLIFETRPETGESFDSMSYAAEAPSEVEEFS